MKTLGNRLEYIRKNLDLTAKKVQEQTNTDNLGRYEKDERKPSIDTLMALSDFYKVSTDWLLTGKDSLNTLKKIDINQYQNNLTTYEQELLSYFAKMSDIDKGRALEDFKNKTDDKKSAKNKFYNSQKDNDFCATTETA
jgi:transcriptional regulator with XRE-family HTH domain